MSSPRSMPPMSVLMKLQQQRDPEHEDVVRKRCYSESIGKATNNHNHKSPVMVSMTPPPVTQDQDHHRALVRRRTMQIPKLFGLDSSITKSTEQLGRIRQELHSVNEDLTNVVFAKRRLVGNQSNGSNSDTSSNNSEDGLENSGHSNDFVLNTEIIELCRNAQQDLKMADLARAECKVILAELETAWSCEEKDMISRAGWLDRESQMAFEKMTPGALSKLMSYHSVERNEDDEVETEDDEDVHQIWKKSLRLRNRTSRHKNDVHDLSNQLKRTSL